MQWDISNIVGSAALAVQCWQCTVGSAVMAVQCWQCSVGSAVMAVLAV